MMSGIMLNQRECRDALRATMREGDNCDWQKDYLAFHHKTGGKALLSYRDSRIESMRLACHNNSVNVQLLDRDHTRRIVFAPSTARPVAAVAATSIVSPNDCGASTSVV